MSARPTTLRGAATGLRRTATLVGPHLRQERPLLLAGSGALLVEVAMRLLEPWPLKFVLDALVTSAGGDVAARQPASLPVVLAVAAVGVLLVAGLRAAAAYAMTVCFALAGNRVLSRVRAQVFAHLQSLSLAFHDRARTGDLVTRVTGDVARLQEATVTAALPLVGNVVTLAGMLTVIAVLDLQLALLVLVVIPVFALTAVRLTKRIGAVAREQRSSEGALASLTAESLGAVRVVQTYGLQGRLQDSFGGTNTRNLRDGVKARKLSAGLERGTDLLIGLATALVLYVGARRVAAGALSPGELVVFLTYLKSALRPVRDLAKYTGRIAKAAASGERVVDLLATRADVVDAPGAVPAPRLRGEVALEGVEVSYAPGSPVLRGLDLRVAAGEHVTVVGPSGSGKSTLVSLLSRLRDPEGGRVLLDGHDVRSLTLDSVRGQVAVVLQESVLLATSVRDNIACAAQGATDEQVVEAARLAGAHEFVTALPDGYDTVLGERGATLSGGQRQRLAIARAAVRRAPVVVLDEALTGLDEATAAEVGGALARLTAGRTTITITHDLEAAARADRVVRIERGVVVADGPPEAVLPDRRGVARAAG